MQPDRIQIIANGEVYSPTHSFGVDSSRVLEEIMDTSRRAHEIQDLLDGLSEVVSKGDLERARALVDELSGKIGQDDADVIRARTLIDFIGGE